VSSILNFTTHCVPKNVTTLFHYKSDIHESILIIFGTNQMLLRKYVIKKCFIFPPHIFPPHLTSASVLHGEMKKDKGSILSLQCCTVALPDFNQSLA